MTLLIGLKRILKKLGIEMLIESCFCKVLGGGIVHSCYRSVLDSVDSWRVGEGILVEVLVEVLR
jgi:hypothetical protein